MAVAVDADTGAGDEIAGRTSAIEPVAFFQGLLLVTIPASSLLETHSRQCQPTGAYKNESAGRHLCPLLKLRTMKDSQ